MTHIRQFIEKHWHHPYVDPKQNEQYFNQLEDEVLEAIEKDKVTEILFKKLPKPKDKGDGWVKVEEHRQMKDRLYLYFGFINGIANNQDALSAHARRQVKQFLKDHPLPPKQ